MCNTTTDHADARSGGLTNIQIVEFKNKWFKVVTSSHKRKVWETDCQQSVLYSTLLCVICEGYWERRPYGNFWVHSCRTASWEYFAEIIISAELKMALLNFLCAISFLAARWKSYIWSWVLWDYLKTMALTARMKLLHSTQTHIPTSERAGCPPPAPVSRLEHTDRPQSRQWSQPSRTLDLSVRQNKFSSSNVIFAQKHKFPHPAPVLYITVAAKCWFTHYGHYGGCRKVVLIYCSS